MKAKEKAKELVCDFFAIQSEEYNYAINWKMAKQCAIICVDEQIEIVKSIIENSMDVHQSLSTPKTLCKDILNPLLKELEEVKTEIQKL